MANTHSDTSIGMTDVPVLTTLNNANITTKCTILTLTTSTAFISTVSPHGTNALTHGENTLYGPVTTATTLTISLVPLPPTPRKTKRPQTKKLVPFL